MRRLLIRPGAIGDLIVSLPALELWAEGAVTELWVPSAHAPLVRHLGRARAISSTGLDLLELPYREQDPDLIAMLRSFDSIVSWYGSNRAEFREEVNQLGLPFEFFPALPSAGDGHAVDFFLRQAGGAPGAAPRLPVERREGGYAVIHPFSGSARKNWPLESFREVARRLEQEMPVYWCAGPDEPLGGAQRFDDLMELARWLAGARVYVGNDSGISHMAAAVGTPTVAIFGPTDPAVWGPRGTSVCLVSPTVEEVSAAISECIRRS